jgi:uncharacterized protein
MHALFVPALLAILVGVALGLLGGGGSILTVPILVYAVGLPAHEAIATSLFVVGATSVAALGPHARAGRVRYATGALFGAASMAGAFAAGRVSRYTPAGVLLGAFGLMMAITAVAMMRKPKVDADGINRQKPRQPLWKIVIEGLLVGAVTGLVGAGGGFLVVPALVILGGLPMREAVGTSLLVIAMKSFAAFAGYVTAVHVDWTIALVVTGAAIAGSFGGTALAGRVPQQSLRKGFAWFVVVTAVFILVQELPKVIGVARGDGAYWFLVAALILPAAAFAAYTIGSEAKKRPTLPQALAGANPGK